MLRFQTGTTSVGDEDRLVHQATARTANNVEQVSALVPGEGRMAVTNTADVLGTSCGSTYSMMHTQDQCKVGY